MSFPQTSSLMLALTAITPLPFQQLLGDTSGHVSSQLASFLGELVLNSLLSSLAVALAGLCMEAQQPLGEWL